VEPLLIHSGGHAHPENLAELVHRLAPKAVAPIHTEAAAQFAETMSNVRVVDDREAVEIASGRESL
jgi:mRNA degradation ribonuclease J1/J2